MPAFGHCDLRRPAKTATKTPHLRSDDLAGVPDDTMDTAGGIYLGDPSARESPTNVLTETT